MVFWISFGFLVALQQIPKDITQHLPGYSRPGEHILKSNNRQMYIVADKVHNDFVRLYLAASDGGIAAAPGVTKTGVSVLAARGAKGLGAGIRPDE